MDGQEAAIYDELHATASRFRTIAGRSGRVGSAVMKTAAAALDRIAAAFVMATDSRDAVVVTEQSPRRPVPPPDHR